MGKKRISKIIFFKEKKEKKERISKENLYIYSYRVFQLRFVNKEDKKKNIFLEEWGRKGKGGGEGGGGGKNVIIENVDSNH